MANVLIIRLSLFGDVAMLVPVAYSIAKTFPEDNFYVLTNRSYQTLFQLDAPNLIPIGISTSEYKGVGGLFRLAEDLKKYNLDKIVDVHDVFRTRFLQFYFRLSGKEVVCIDKGRKERSDVISHKVQLKPLRHTMDRYRDTLAEVGYKADNKFSNYTKHSISSISLPKEFSVSPDTKNIGIAPFAKHETKTYPLEKMKKVITSLIKEQDMKIYLFGGKDDAVIIDKLQSIDKNVISVAGKLTLQQELLLMSQLKVIVSMDSANMHLASLVNTPIVSVWGATHPMLGYYGFRQQKDLAVQIDLNCRPCSASGNKPCWRSDLACLNLLDPEMIVSKVNDFL